MFLFVLMPFDAAIQSVVRACAARVCWGESTREQGLLNAFMWLSLQHFQLHFWTAALASLPLFALAVAISYKKPYNITIQFTFLAYTSLFSIKSNVLKLNTVQKVYSVNKILFLGMVSSPWFAYMSGYHDVIYHWSFMMRYRIVQNIQRTKLLQLYRFVGICGKTFAVVPCHQYKLHRSSQNSWKNICGLAINSNKPWKREFCPSNILYYMIFYYLRH